MSCLEDNCIFVELKFPNIVFYCQSETLWSRSRSSSRRWLSIQKVYYVRLWERASGCVSDLLVSSCDALIRYLLVCRAGEAPADSFDEVQVSVVGSAASDGLILIVRRDA